MAFENAIRNFEIIERWGIVRLHQRGNLGAHSHRVAIYADQIAMILGIEERETRYEILRYALWHDVLEIKTGDLPAPAKEFILDRAKHDAYEADYINDFKGTDGMGGAQVEGIVKVADLLDATLSLVIDKRMGNELLDDMYQDMSQKLLSAVSALRFGDAKCDAVRREIVNAIGRHTYMPLQPFP
jgi:hypothetical protein